MAVGLAKSFDFCQVADRVDIEINRGVRIVVINMIGDCDLFQTELNCALYHAFHGMVRIARKVAVGMVIVHASS